jgi:hypothetical protein
VIKNEMSLSLFMKKGKSAARNTDKRTFVAEKFRIGYESATQAKKAGITLTDRLYMRHACKKGDMSEASARGICSLEGTTCKVLRFS